MARGRKPMFDEESIKRYVVDCKLSDYEIAKLCNTTRHTVKKYRRAFTEVSKPQNCGRLGEVCTIEELISNGFDCIDMNDNDLKAECDILVDGRVRVEVKASMCGGSQWKFTLSNRCETGVAHSTRYLETNGTKYAKKIKELSDFIILVGFDEIDKVFFVVPTSELKDRQQTISIAKSLNSKWAKFLGRFDLLMEG